MRNRLPVQNFNVPPTLKKLAQCLLFCFVVLPCSELYSQSQLLKDVNTHEESTYSEFKEFATAGTLTYFISNANELWKTDGTTAGTLLVKSFRSVNSLTPVGSLLYFVADDGRGLEVWKTNGI